MQTNELAAKGVMRMGEHVQARVGDSVGECCGERRREAGTCVDSAIVYYLR